MYLLEHIVHPTKSLYKPEIEAPCIFRCRAGAEASGLAAMGEVVLRLGEQGGEAVLSAFAEGFARELGGTSGRRWLRDTRCRVVLAKSDLRCGHAGHLLLGAIDNLLLSILFSL